MKLIILYFFVYVACSLIITSDLRVKCKVYEDNCNNDSICKSMFVPIWGKCNQMQAPDFQKCVTSELTKAGVSRSKKGNFHTQYLEVCYYEESKELGTLSYYKNGAPTDAVDGLDKFDFKWTLPEVIDTNTKLKCLIDAFWQPEKVKISLLPPTKTEVSVTQPDGKSKIEERDNPLNPNFIPHINIHACLMTATQKTCSAKFYKTATITKVDHGFWSTALSPTKNLPLEYTLNGTGTWRIMGHVYFYINETGPGRLRSEMSSYPKWDVAKVLEIEVVQGTTTTPNPACESQNFKRVQGELTSCLSDAAHDAGAKCGCYQRSATQLKTGGCPEKIDDAVAECKAQQGTNQPLANCMCDGKSDPSGVEKLSLQLVFTIMFILLFL